MTLKNKTTLFSGLDNGDLKVLNELKIYNNEYFSCSVKESDDIRMNVLRENICDNTLYKFMEFTENNDLNKKKLDSLLNGTLWFSHYIYLNDKTEFELKYSPKKVGSKALVVNSSQNDIRINGIFPSL